MSGDCHNQNPNTGQTGHFYERDGKFYPSVTTILDAMLPPEEKAGIIRWKKKTPNWKEIQKKSQIVGTIGHFRVLNSLVDYTIEMPDIPVDDYPEDLFELVELVSYLWTQSGLEKQMGFPRRVETTLVSEKYLFAGKPDLRCPIMEKGGFPRLTIVDLKTSPTVYKKYIYQLAAYGLMMEESEADNYKFPDQGMVVCLCPYEEKNPTLEPKVRRIKKETLLKYAGEFITMAENYHKQIGM